MPGSCGFARKCEAQAIGKQVACVKEEPGPTRTKKKSGNGGAYPVENR